MNETLLRNRTKKNLGKRAQVFFQVCGITLLLSVAFPVFAESAPVYDADQMPQQFDTDMDQPQQDLPPPPPPGPVQVQEGNPENTFVPMQQQPLEQQPMEQLGPSQHQIAANQQPVPSLSISDRLRRVEQQIDNMQNSDSSPRIDALQDQVRLLRSQVEQLTHQLEQYQNQQQSLYSDLEKRIAQQALNSTKPLSNAAGAAVDDSSAAAKSNRKLVGGVKATIKPVATITPTPDMAPIKPSDSQPNVAEEQQIYQTAYNLIKAKKYNDAVAVLQNMLQKYPRGQFASNAHYWLGELYGLLGKNDQALVEFNTVVRSYPDSPRLSDAQLKVGLIYAAQFKWVDAKNAFKKVINRYPGTTSARLASEQLKQIKQAGH